MPPPVPDPDRVSAALPSSRALQLQRRFALLQHRRYLATLLARYHGPYHAAWAAELARVDAHLAALIP